MSERNLSIELRPKSLASMIGADQARTEIMSVFHSGRVPTAWLFFGPPGTGKTTLARILAVLVQDEPTVPADSFDIVEMNAADATGVDAMRDLIQSTFFFPSVGKYRVYILDEAQKLSASAQDLLLKAMEDTPEGTMWIICSSAPSKLNKALRSRCYPIEMKLLSPANVKELVLWALTELKSDAGALSYADQITDALIAGEVFSPRSVVMVLERCLNGATAAEAVSSVKDEAVADTIDLCRAASRGDWEAARALLLTIDADTVISVRAALCGYFKAVMLKNPISNKSTICATVIKELSQSAGYDNKTQFALLCATLYTACSKIKAALTNGANSR
jgi:replication-associated recombination protein RarA